MDGGCVTLIGQVRASSRSATSYSGKTTILAIKSLWSVALLVLNNLNDAITVVLQQELQKDSGGASGLVLDCIVCLTQVSPGEEYRQLPNCNHGSQFHGDCMDAWLKNHSTCPLCRSHIPRPLLHRLHDFWQHLYDALLSYLHSALENVSKSIGEIQC